MMDNPFSALAIIAEQRIAEAVANGELDNLPGSGKPLPLEDLSHIPPELRMAYKILKNAGCLPPEIIDRKEAGNLVELLDNCEDERENLVRMRKLRIILNRMEYGRQRGAQLEKNDDYYQKILSRLEVHERRQKKNEIS